MTGDVFKCSFLEGRVKIETFSIIEKKNPSTTGALVIKLPSRCKKRARLCLWVQGKRRFFWVKGIELAGDGQHSDAPSELGLCPAGVRALGGCGSRQVHAGSSAGFPTSHLKQGIAPRTGTQGLFSPQVLSREVERRSGTKLL